MRILRLAGVLIALAAALVAGPARADDPGLSLQLSIGWDGGAVAGSWVPFLVNVRNDSSSQDFSGTIVIRPRGPSGGAAAGTSNYGTTYAQSLLLPHASQKTVTLFGAYTEASGGGSGYIAALEDRNGTQVARSPIAIINPGRLAVGLLSDSLQAGAQIKDSAIQAAAVGVVQFTPQSLPGGAALLGGLGVVVIDNFDTSALSQAQGRALEQYVGLGGQLVLAGGSNWRRTLSQLPPALVPLQAQGTAVTSLDPILDLFAQHTTLRAPSVVGALLPGARVVLSDPAGRPLLAELNYGAGRVVQVAYDPAEEPVASHAEVVRASWQAILGRVSPPTAGNGRQGSGGVILAPAPGQFATSPGTVDDALSSLLNDTPANSLPPLRLLGGLLVVYVLIAGPLNYGVLRRLRKRELTWVTVPLIAVVFTAGAYAGGIVVHGRDYYVNEIQVLRVTPGGALDLTGYDAVFSPSRGDIVVRLPGSSLASTYLPVTAALGQGSDDRVLGGPNPRVSLSNVAIWTPRDFKTNASQPSPIAVEAHLRIESGKLKGTITNRGRTAIRRLALFTTDGRVIPVAPLLAPGSTLDVSGALPNAPGAAAGGALGGNQNIAALPSGDNALAVMTAAADSFVSQTSQVHALAGVVDGLPGFRVSGLLPTRNLIAGFAQPLTLESVDSLPAGWSAPRQVAGNGLTGAPVSVVDYELPGMPAATQLKIGATDAAATGAPPLSGPAPMVEIFDWATSQWSPADLTHPFALSAGQRGPDLVRLRVRGGLYLPGLMVTSAK